MKFFRLFKPLLPGLYLVMPGLRAVDVAISELNPTLWYRKPSGSLINEGLPIGTAQIGGLILGGIASERIVLNEESLWTRVVSWKVKRASTNFRPSLSANEFP